MDIKEVLMSGDATAEELLEQFKEQLATAQKEVDEAKRVEEEKQHKIEAEEELNSVREYLVLAIIDYLNALDLLEDEELNDEDIDKLCDAFKEVEKSIKTYTKTLDCLKAIGGKPSENAIINDFLKTIM